MRTIFAEQKQSAATRLRLQFIRNGGYIHSMSKACIYVSFFQYRAKQGQIKLSRTELVGLSFSQAALSSSQPPVYFFSGRVRSPFGDVAYSQPRKQFFYVHTRFTYYVIFLVVVVVVRWYKNIFFSRLEW